MRVRTVAVVVLLVLASVAPAAATSSATAPAAAAQSATTQSTVVRSAAIRSTVARSAPTRPAATRVESPRPATSSATPTRSVEAGSDDVGLTRTLSLTPERPGEIDVVVRFSIPDRVSELRTTLPPGATVRSASGFAAGDGGNEYEWDGRTDSPRLAFRVPVNRTAESGRLAEDPPVGAAVDVRPGAHEGGAVGPADSHSADDGYLFADVGPWALVQPPQVGVGWRYTGDPPRLDRRTTVDGEGAVRGRMAFLGEHETYVREAHGQTFRLVVPAAADMAEDPETVLDAVANASDALRVGDRDDEVLLVAAPSGPDWVVRGLQTGEAEAWVRADERLATPENVWLHEYVHTRQGFETTDGTRWLLEGSAHYYAALLALEGDLVGFDEFATYLAAGERRPYADAVLAEPGTWAGGANYVKGGLVAGELDRRIRVETDSEATLGSVLARLNARDGPVTADGFRRAVDEAGGRPVADDADRYTATEAVPGMWERPAHDEAFGRLPARVTVTPPDDADVSGPYRNGSLTAPPSIAAGETLTLRPTVGNVGGTPGEFELALRVDGERVDAATGRLDPDETATVPLSHTFDAPGRYTLSVGDRQYEVRVSEPATPTVGTVRANRTTVAPGEAVRLTATVRNDASVPADGEVPVVIDGETLRTETVRLAPGGGRELSVVVRFEAAGERRVAFGDRSATVTVDRGDEGTDVTTPGFGTFPTAAALAALTALLASRFGRSSGRGGEGGRSER
ncbi:hypothetical protein [Halorarum salinum]|uniref:CARDB domain-containing protein n=1 Tax=Halorarum salinum TaxID=2743089 RepID=A0A7D5L9Z9_9EURY|nr:hypothetical protein [Halobaculum salinum]QLG61229.1 hypothetical protein HUG12_05560 [Halobaculum salinum]